MSKDWFITIDAEKKGMNLNIEEVFKYRDLFFFLVFRGIKVKYAQSVLGISWAVIQPLFTTLIFTVIFGNLAKVNTNGVPYALFSFIAMVPWNYFSNTLTDSANSLVQNQNLISKVYFPRILLPLSSAVSKLIDFLIGLAVLVFFLIYYQVSPNLNYLILPLFVVILLFSSLGMGMILSAMAVQYRDIKYGMVFFVQLLMYISPIIYPVSAIPESYVLLYSINPMVGVIEGFRTVILGDAIPWMIILVSSVSSIVFFLFGVYFFSKMERHFADVV